MPVLTLQVRVKPAPQQKVNGLALVFMRPIARVWRGQAATNQKRVGKLRPIAFKSIQRRFDQAVVQPVGAKFGADPARAVAAGGAVADQGVGKAGIALPAIFQQPRQDGFNFSRRTPARA